MTISKESAQSLGEAINNAAAELPFGYEVALLIESHFIGCALLCPDGETEDFSYDNVDNSIIEAVARANEIERNKNEDG